MNEQSDQKSKSAKATIVIGLIKLLASMPLSLAKAVLRPFVWIQWVMQKGSYLVAKQNLKYCLPDKSDTERKAICRGVIKHNMNLVAETSHIWLHDYPTNRKMITELNGLDALGEAIKSDQGTIIFSPHLGNWELTYGYLTNEFQSAGIYRPPNIPELDDIMSAGRGGKVFRTEVRDIRNMLKELKNGGSLFLLPDQQPPKGSGVFAPFFGIPAYTMTLVHGLLNRTGSDFWLCYTLNQQDGSGLYAKEISINSTLEAEDFARELNKTMEEVIMQAPEQYQWTYKRFKRTPDGSPHIYQRQE